MVQLKSIDDGVKSLNVNQPGFKARLEKAEQNVDSVKQDFNARVKTETSGKIRLLENQLTAFQGLDKAEKKFNEAQKHFEDVKQTSNTRETELIQKVHALERQLANLQGEESASKLVAQGIKELGAEKSVREQLAESETKRKAVEDERDSLQSKYITDVNDLRQALLVEQGDKERLNSILEGENPPYIVIKKDLEIEQKARRDLQGTIDSQSPTYTKLKEDLSVLQKKLDEDKGNADKMGGELLAAVAGNITSLIPLGTTDSYDIEKNRMQRVLQGQSPSYTALKEDLHNVKTEKTRLEGLLGDQIPSYK